VLSRLYIPDCIRSFWPVVYTTNKTFFKRGQVKKRVFTHFLTELMPFPPLFTLLPLEIAFIFSKIVTPSSPLPFTTMCFHRWPFIERGIFENPSGVVWLVNMEGVSLGVSLTIMISCSLEAHVVEAKSLINFKDNKPIWLKN